MSSPYRRNGQIMALGAAAVAAVVIVWALLHSVGLVPVPW